MSPPEWHSTPLSFEIAEDSAGPIEGRRLTITSVVRDDYGVRINYEIVPPLPKPLHGPGGVAEDDLGNRYEDLGGAIGHDPVRSRTDGVLTMPLPPPGASALRVRFGWSQGPATWQRKTHAVRILLHEAAASA